MDAAPRRLRRRAVGPVGAHPGASEPLDPHRDREHTEGPSAAEEDARFRADRPPHHDRDER